MMKKKNIKIKIIKNKNNPLNSKIDKNIEILIFTSFI